MSLSLGQSRAIAIAEQVSSVLSLLGTTFIIATFLWDKNFRKPINRLVFYASWGNIVTNVATLIGLSGPHFGTRTPLCQFQAFIIQWLMPADALWTFAMACNVYLTFFHDYDAARLRTLELRYLAFCYGLPFIPAFVYCFVQSTERGKIYGSAILWCWVSLEWDILRIATFYAPVWIIIIATVAIYVRAGLVVFKWRDMVLALAHSHNPPAISNDEGKSSLQARKIARLSAEDATGASKNKYVPERKAATNISKHQPSVSTETSNDALQGRNHGRPEISTSFAPAIAQRNQSVVSSTTSRSLPTSAQAKKAAVNYCHCAVLFFAALLVTWVPSSINRVYTLVHPESFVFGLNYVSALVLPLQGFWNSVVYAVTSFAACKAMFERFGKRAHKAQQPDMSVELGSDSEVRVLSDPSPFHVDA